MRTVFGATLALLASAGLSSALTISEPPDLPGGTSPSAPSLGTLSVGENFLSGSLTGTCELGDCNFVLGDTQDSARITIAAGTQLVDAFFGSEGGHSGGTMDLTFSFSPVGATGGSALLFEAVPLNTGESVMSFFGTPVGPIGAGDYFVSAFGGSGDDGDFEASWTMTLDVEAVSQTPVIPLPAGMPLLLGGLGVLALARPRRG
ncbi:MAG: hypothetical protein V2I65_19080 [Paracoccaceae bacterium]|jgi:hypothetical protein|nr:hypothetical protein [Paracoccaceae bacterium]